MTRKINNLAVGVGIEMDFDRLLRLNNLNLITPSIVDTGNSASMRGVGIVLGIAPDARGDILSEMSVSTIAHRGFIPGPERPGREGSFLEWKASLCKVRVLRLLREFRESDILRTS